MRMSEWLLVRDMLATRCSAFSVSNSVGLVIWSLSKLVRITGEKKQLDCILDLMQFRQAPSGPL